MKKRGRPRLNISLTEDQKKELNERLKSVQKARHKERLIALKMAHSGQHTTAQIAVAIGRGKNAITNWLANFKRGGFDKILHVGRGPGSSRTMTEQDDKALLAKLAEGEFRTAVQARQWLENERGIKLKQSSIYKHLHRLGGKLKMPRKVHIKKNAAAEEEFKTEGFYAKLVALPIPRDTSSKIKFWVMDEKRNGLIPTVRRVWGLSGVRQVSPYITDYQSEYTHGAVDFVNFEAEFFHAPTVNLEVQMLFINQLIATDPSAHHIIVGDQAGFHYKENDARLPKNVHIVPLPPYSPELNPIEKLWDYLGDTTCNRTFDSLDTMRAHIDSWLKDFYTDKARIRRLVCNSYLHLFANNTYPYFIPV